MAYYSKKETERQIQSERAGKGGNGDHEGGKGKKSQSFKRSCAMVPSKAQRWIADCSVHIYFCLGFGSNSE